MTYITVPRCLTPPLQRHGTAVSIDQLRLDGFFVCTHPKCPYWLLWIQNAKDNPRLLIGAHDTGRHFVYFVNFRPAHPSMPAGHEEEESQRACNVKQNNATEHLDDYSSETNPKLPSMAMFHKVRH
ncbi:uncharacterized protein LAJ45_09924 [Morchella importuna]|uniref:uncharacterized protein n=1 Tax=Morchella importuna TaxID=1174673 RepID=UPI001E8D5C56|nr:uncharacterized protein LAJ45_09924 [Morchella importuna]KAH8146002.1 hypothetical protein LAJ45_09924 [Morchella importuna]